MLTLDSGKRGPQGLPLALGARDGFQLLVPAVPASDVGSIFRSFRLRADSRTIWFGPDEFGETETQTLPAAIKSPLSNQNRQWPPV